MNVEIPFLQQYLAKAISTPPVIPHPTLADTVIIPNCGPRECVRHTRKVIVDLQCGLAVMRGADVFAPGVMAAPKGVRLLLLCYSLYAQ